MFSVRHPDRIPRDGKLRMHLRGLPARRRYDIDLGRTGNQAGAEGARPVSQRLAVGGKLRTVPFLRHEPRLSAEGAADVDAASVTLGAKSDPRAVRGEYRLVIVGLVARAADRLAAAGLLDPDVQVPPAAAIGSVSQQLPIRRKGSFRAQPGIRGQPCQNRPWRGGRRLALPPED